MVAALTVPHLIDSLGSERFGLLTLAWALIGYAGALDLGVGRATTQYVAQLRANEQTASQLIHSALVTAIRVTLLTGCLGALIILFAAMLGIGNLVKVSQVRSSDIKYSLFLLAIALPMQAMSATYRGINEAYFNFKGISALKIMLGAANFGAPFVISLYTNKIYLIIASLVISRGIALYCYRALAYSCMPAVIGQAAALFSMAVAKKLFQFGGWFTLSSLLNPIVGSADRLIISSVISAFAVSLYVIPYEMVVQSLVLVGAVTTVMFPHLSRLRIAQPEKVKRLFYKSLVIVVVLMACVALFFIVFGKFVLALWLGSGAVVNYYPVMAILSVGLIPYAIGTMCTSLLHAYGKTALTARINLIEFPIFLGMIYLFITNFGVIGAAYAWIIRVTLDCLIMFFCASRCK